MHIHERNDPLNTEGYLVVYLRRDLVVLLCDMTEICDGVHHLQQLPSLAIYEPKLNKISSGEMPGQV